jgi:GAF domain-containing protein/HAMP domain-containing protein
MVGTEGGVGSDHISNPAGDMTPTGRTSATTDADRRGALERMILVATVVSGVTSIAYTVIALLRDNWWILADAVGIALGFMLLLLARRAARRDKLETAGYWVLSATLVAFIPGELFWANQTAYFTSAVILLLALVGYVIRPRRWWIWGAATAFYLACIFAINWQEALLPFERYAIDQDPTMRFAAPSIVVALVVVIGVQAFLAYRRIRTIRVRLLVSFVSVGVLPVIVIALTGTLFAWRSGQRDAIEKLDLAASFVSSELDAWVDSLADGLGSVLTEGEAISYVRLVLRPRITGPDTADTYAMLRVTLIRLLRDHVEQSELFDEMFMVGTDGVAVLSSGDAFVGQQYGDQPFFQHGVDGFFVQVPFSPAPGEPSVVIAAVPVLDEQSNVLGVLAGQASASAVDEIIGRRIGVAESGEVYLVGADGIALTELRIGLSSVGVSSEGARAALMGQAGATTYENYHGLPVVGAYRWLPRLGVALLVEQPQSVTFAPLSTMFIANGSIGLIVAATSVAIALRLTQNISRPLAELVGTAGRIAQGDLDLSASVGRVEEIGALARAFNSMTAQLRDLVGGLEQRVAERTTDLERRSFYLEAAAQVGRTAFSILDPDRLFRVIVELIRDQFDLYYVGLFQVGEGGEWAELRAGTGEAGRRMLARGHRIRIDEGMVGWTIRQAEARIASEAWEDDIRLGQEELPDTRSEAALPLRSRGRVLGALTVQSDQPDAFDQDLLVVLQTMADQVAVALDNARLFEDSQAALVAARRASGDQSRAAWAEVLRARADLGFRGRERGIERAYDVWRPEMEQAAESGVPVIAERVVGADTGWSLAVPVRIHGEVIGVLDLQKPEEAGEWTAVQVALAEQIAEQLSQALENARLYEETQRRGIREQQLREIGTRMQSTVDLDAILRMAIEDLAKALDVPSAFVQLYEGRHLAED